jgi:large subunit ribosomal protein L18e
MISKTKIEERLKRKTNSVLVETIILAKASNQELAGALAAPSRNRAKVNVDAIQKNKSETIIVPGKVLSSGEISRKAKVYALGFSEKAEEKLKNAGCTYSTILEELKKNPKLKGAILR